MVVGMASMFLSSGALELLYHGTTIAFLSESKILIKIFAKVSVTVLNAASGREGGIVIHSLNRISEGS